jgi:hypothetical protein
MSKPVQRNITANIAFMEDKATIFNTAINSQRLRWEKFVSSIVQGLIEINRSKLKTGICTIVNVQSKTTEEREEPIIYYLGGSGYAAYNRLIMENGGDDIFKEAPRTHDWDISFATNGKDESMIDNSRKYLIKMMTEKFNELNQDNYVVGNFEEINKYNEQEAKKRDDAIKNGLTPPKAENETVLGVFGPKDHEVIELSYLRNKLYENIRLNLVKKINDEYEKNHIIEFVFWFGKRRQEYITQTVRLIYPDVAYYMPIPKDLIKSNLISLINRSTNPARIAKCRQDYLRVENLIKRIQIIKVYMPKIIEDFKYITLFLEKIKTYIPQCIDILEKDTFDLITSNLRTKGRRNKLVTKFNELLTIDYNYFIVRAEIEKEIQSLPAKEHLKEELDEGEGTPSILKTADIEDELDYFEQKYLKYKQKYFGKLK